MAKFKMSIFISKILRYIMSTNIQSSQVIFLLVGQ